MDNGACSMTWWEGWGGFFVQGEQNHVVFND